jgi:hypothetical protein
MKPHHRTPINRVEKMGATDVRIQLEKCGKHPRLHFTMSGKSYRIVIPFSPSCHRSLLNTLRDIRHITGEVQSC